MFESFLKQHDAAAWTRTRQALASDIHEVDRNATEIWFHLYPLKLAEAFAQAADPAELRRTLRLDGDPRLAEQCDTSHWFFYGHRYWPQVKAAILNRAAATTASPSLDLAAIVRDIAKDAATAARADVSLTLGIAAAGLMTLQQIGLAAFRASAGVVKAPSGLAAKTPAQILASRKKDDGQGIMGLVRGIRSQFTATFDERRADGRFTVVNDQQLTTASANDTRDYSSFGPRRCHEGPIPVECRTATCGTCWVGILAGAEKLSPVDELEATRMKEFGYVSSDNRQPIIRLSCMAAASGNVTIVIPTWNGYVGKAGLGN